MEVGLVSSDNVTGVLSFGGGVHFFCEYLCEVFKEV